MIAVAIVLFLCQSASCQSFSLSIRKLGIGAKERVCGFEFNLKSGRISEIHDLPRGWNINVDNDPSWNVTVTGSLIVGAAALDANFFKRFLVFEKNGSLGVPFDLAGEVIVTENFENVRRVKIDLKDCVITKLKK